MPWAVHLPTAAACSWFVLRTVLSCPFYGVTPTMPSAPVFPPIPADAIEFVRSAFRTANASATLVLTRQPSMHEEALDQQIITALDGVGSRIMPASGTAVGIETHWLGGRRHYGNWEIADIAVAVVARRVGMMAARKVALLQSKRLYSRELSVREEDVADYMEGIGRLIEIEQSVSTMTAARTFTFGDDCVYGQIEASGKQAARIEGYVAERGIPVYYSLYNPAAVPMSGTVPQINTGAPPPAVEVGCRVLAMVDVHGVLSGMAAGQRPRFSDLVRTVPAGSEDPFASHGWRLEDFIADEVLKCREGRLFEREKDVDLDRLLRGRSAPISAAIVVTIDLARGDG